MSHTDLNIVSSWLGGRLYIFSDGYGSRLRGSFARDQQYSWSHAGIHDAGDYCSIDTEREQRRVELRIYHVRGAVHFSVSYLLSDG